MKSQLTALVAVAALQLSTASPILLPREDVSIVGTQADYISTFSFFHDILYTAAPFGNDTIGLAPITTTFDTISAIRNGTFPHAQLINLFPATPSIILDPIGGILCRFIDCRLINEINDSENPLTIADQLSLWSNGTAPVTLTGNSVLISPAEATDLLTSMTGLAVVSHIQDRMIAEAGHTKFKARAVIRPSPREPSVTLHVGPDGLNYIGPPSQILPTVKAVDSSITYLGGGTGGNAVKIGGVGGTGGTGDVAGESEGAGSSGGGGGGGSLWQRFKNWVFSPTSQE